MFVLDHGALEVVSLKRAVNLLKRMGFTKGGYERGAWGRSMKMSLGSQIVQLHISKLYPDIRPKTDNHLGFKVASISDALKILKEWASENNIEIEVLEEDGSWLVYFPGVLCFFIELQPAN